MIDINELRRLAQAAMTGPDGVSLNWVKLLEDFQKEANPAAINELLDRLEVAEKSDAESIAMYRKARDARDELRAKLESAEKERTIDEQRIADLMAELNRVGQENEELRARIEAAEKERDWNAERLEDAIEECTALRTCIEEMEKQEPVAKVRVHQAGGNAGLAWSVAPLNDFDSLPLMRDGDRLYALPGAQPAPSISPVALRHVIQWLRNGCDPMKAADELEMLAAAPEAKPCP